MRKLVVLGLLLAMSTGCGRGWFPHLFRGAPCNGLCSMPAPTLESNCADCQPGSGYASYDDGGMVTEGTYPGGVIGSAPIQTYETVPPLMQSIPQGAIQAPASK